VALACPTTGIEFDERTLELLDADKDKRIRAPELLAAVKWLGAVLRDPDVLVEGASELKLSPSTRRTTRASSCSRPPRPS
jgi:hypothetical protein